MDSVENSPADRSPAALGRAFGRQPGCPPIPLKSPIKHLDGRSYAARRAKELAAELERGFTGNIAVAQRRLIEQAAFASAIAEDLAQRQLRGLPVRLDEVLRAQGVARRAIQSVQAEAAAKQSAKSALDDLNKLQERR